MASRGTKEWLNNFIIWRDNGRWQPRSYLQPDGTWGEDPSKAADFPKRQEAYAFTKATFPGITNTKAWNNVHAGHRWY